MSLHTLVLRSTDYVIAMNPTVVNIVISAEFWFSAKEDGQLYHPMFFTHDHSFEEFYCTCIQLLNKTWKEMKATTADFAKVFPFFPFNTIFVSSHMYPENPEGSQVIVGSMNMGLLSVSSILI